MEYNETEGQFLNGVELKQSLAQTRNGDGLPLFKVAEIIKEVFDKAEVESLIRELQNNGNGTTPSEPVKMES